MDKGAKQIRAPLLGEDGAGDLDMGAKDYLQRWSSGRQARGKATCGARRLCLCNYSVAGGKRDTERQRG